MEQELIEYFKNKKILILGFGREGRSSYDLITKLLPNADITVADEKEQFFLVSSPLQCQGVEYKPLPCKTVFGSDYLSNLDSYDIILKSPGIALKNNVSDKIKSIITSQTDLFLRFTKCPVIGITGTKGKSTTSSLIYYFLTKLGIKSRLVGNIGVPVFSDLDNMDDKTVIVYELSCHQLEYVKASPNVAVLLNVYSDHLDHYASFNDYRNAKYNIFKYQKQDDTLIVSNICENIDNSIFKCYPMKKIYLGAEVEGEFCSGVSEKELIVCNNHIDLHRVKTNLIGIHNLYNISAAMTAAYQFGCSIDDMLDILPEFYGLEHRLEYVGKYNNVKYYNDSISTIPEASERAIEAIGDVSTLLVGGMDRGIDYDSFAQYISESKVENIIFMYDSGKRIYSKFSDLNHNNKIYYTKDLAQAVILAKKITKGGSCLMSPAAASYGYFKNFEERGTCFKKLVRSEM